MSRESDIQKWMLMWGFPKRHIKYERSDMIGVKPSIIDKVEKYSEEYPYSKGLYLFSKENSSGKTMLATYAVKQIMRQHRLKLGVYWYTTTLIEALRDNLDNRTELINLKERIFKADLVVLDDLGKEITSMFAARMLNMIIDELYREEKRVIITSNIELSELQICRRSEDVETNYTGSIVGRLSEMVDIIYI